MSCFSKEVTSPATSLVVRDVLSLYRLTGLWRRESSLRWGWLLEASQGRVGSENLVGVYQKGEGNGQAVVWHS